MLNRAQNFHLSPWNCLKTCSFLWVVTYIKPQTQERVMKWNIKQCLSGGSFIVLTLVLLFLGEAQRERKRDNIKCGVAVLSCALMCLLLLLFLILAGEMWIREPLLHRKLWQIKDRASMEEWRVLWNNDVCPSLPRSQAGFLWLFITLFLIYFQYNNLNLSNMSRCWQCFPFGDYNLEFQKGPYWQCATVCDITKCNQSNMIILRHSNFHLYSSQLPGTHRKICQQLESR